MKKSLVIFLMLFFVAVVVFVYLLFKPKIDTGLNGMLNEKHNQAKDLDSNLQPPAFPEE